MLNLSVPSFHAVNTGMLCLCHHLKVVWIVVPFITIFMVDDLSGQELSAEHFLRNSAVHVAALQLDVVFPAARVP